MTQRVHAGLEPIEEYVLHDPDGVGPDPCTWTLAREFIWGARFPEPLVMVDWTAAGAVPAGSEEVLHYVRDALGSVVGLLDAGQPDATPEPVPAKPVERYDYDPYGKTYIAHWDPAAGSGSGDWVRHEPDEPSAFGNPFMWTGQRHDVAIGLYHFPFRTYSPRLGRWLQRDPLGYVDGVNTYAYAGSSPTNLIDPLGFTSLLPEAPGSDYDPMLGPFGGDDEMGPPLPPKPDPCEDGTNDPNGDKEDGSGRGGPNATGPSEEDIRQLIALIAELASRLGISVGPLDLVDEAAIQAFLDWLMEAFLAREDVTTDLIPVTTDRIPIVDQMSIWDRATFAVTGFVIAITGGPALSSTAAGFWDDTNEYWTCTHASAGLAIGGVILGTGAVGYAALTGGLTATTAASAAVEGGAGVATIAVQQIIQPYDLSDPIPPQEPIPPPMYPGHDRVVPSIPPDLPPGPLPPLNPDDYPDFWP